MNEACPVARLIEAHRPRLLALFAGRLPPGLRARLSPEDLLQECYRRAAERYPSSPPPAGLELAWLYGHGRNCLAEAWRHHARGKRDVRAEQVLPDLSSLCPHQPVDPRTGPRTAAERAERRETVRRAFQSLPEEEQELLRLRLFDELTLAEMAVVLGRTLNATAGRYYRAAAAFKALIRQSHPELEGSR